MKLRDALLFDKHSSSSHTVFINTIRVLNSCDDNEEKKKHCLDFFLECVQRRNNNSTTEFFIYPDVTTTPWTLADAQKVTSSIAPINNPIKLLELSGDNLLSNKGTFECVFNEVLDGGMVLFFRFETWLYRKIKFRYK